MVNISVIVEGAVFDTNASETMIDNSNALRESMHRIFSEALNRDDVSIEVHMNAGNRSAARAFVNAGKDSFLYTDLDTDSTHKGNWFFKMSGGMNPITFPPEKIPFIFFMIQEMEAWILKQPDAIEGWAKSNNFKHFPRKDNVAKHRLIAGKDIESIAEPNKKLADIIKQTFQSDKKTKKGKIKGVIYGKLKSAPGLLDHLDVEQLLLEDTELMSFCEKVEEITNNE